MTEKKTKTIEKIKPSLDKRIGFQIYRGVAGEYLWRMMDSKTGETLLTSSRGYRTEGDALEAVEELMRAFAPEKSLGNISKKTRLMKARRLMTEGIVEPKEYNLKVGEPVLLTKELLVIKANAETIMLFEVLNLD